MHCHCDLLCDIKGPDLALNVKEMVISAAIEHNVINLQVIYEAKVLIVFVVQVQQVLRTPS